MTHLVADNATSAKYRSAVANGIAVVNLDWLAACCRKNTLVSPTLPQFRVMPLGGCTICASGFSPADKLKIADTVQRLGGRYEKDMSSDGVTLLIALEPEGRKFSCVCARTRV